MEPSLKLKAVPARKSESTSNGYTSDDTTEAFSGASTLKLGYGTPSKDRLGESTLFGANESAFSRPSSTSMSWEEKLLTGPKQPFFSTNDSAKLSSSFTSRNELPPNPSLAETNDPAVSRFLDQLNPKHSNTFLASNSPDVLGVVSHVLSQSPAPIHDPNKTPILPPRPAQLLERGTSSPTYRQYHDMVGKLLKSETPVPSMRYHGTEDEDESEGIMSMIGPAGHNRQGFESDLSFNAKPWGPGPGLFSSPPSNHPLSNADVLAYTTSRMTSNHQSINRTIGSSILNNEGDYDPRHHRDKPRTNFPSTSLLNGDDLPLLMRNDHPGSTAVASGESSKWRTNPNSVHQNHYYDGYSSGVDSNNNNNNNNSKQQHQRDHYNNETGSAGGNSSGGDSGSENGGNDTTRGSFRPKYSHSDANITTSKQHGGPSSQSNLSSSFQQHPNNRSGGILSHSQNGVLSNRNSHNNHPLRSSKDSILSNESTSTFGQVRRSHDRPLVANKPPHHLHLHQPQQQHIIANPTHSISTSTDFVESPRSRAAYKEFANTFRTKSKESSQHAEEFALKTVRFLPEHAKWRVYIELAELAKKNNEYEKAREWYIQACSSQRRAASTWLEWSKMEEENGHPIEAMKILTLGIIICKLNEALLPRLIKLRERLHHYGRIRGVLSALKYESLEKAWKSILEGSLFEARTGNSNVAREIFKFLVKYVPWYGPIYQEAYRLEEREERDDDALKIILKGLNELPRYGPLWFGLIHIMERRDLQDERKLWNQGITPPLRRVNEQCAEAVKSISKELTWRVYYDRYCAEERAMEMTSKGYYYHTDDRNVTLRQCRHHFLQNGRRSLTQALLLCPLNLRWKLLLVGARMELSVSNVITTRRLLWRALQEVPPKSKSNVVIECSRVEEYLGNVEVARKMLYKARIDPQADWRVFLESMMLEARQGDYITALMIAKVSVQNHPGTGRIWALCIQLYHRWEVFRLLYGPGILLESLGVNISTSLSLSMSQSLNLQSSSSLRSPKETIIRQAIAEVPKSGEVWCEQGRCRLNPFMIDDFDLSKAQQSFAFAIQFTPQYGDTFVEYLRFEFLCRTCLREVCLILGIHFERYVSFFLTNDVDGDLIQWIKNMQDDGRSSNRAMDAETLRKNIADVLTLKYPLEQQIGRLNRDQYPQLLRRCVNADPNYGVLWYHCRPLPEDIPTKVVQRARWILQNELLDTYPVYMKAVLLYVRRTIDQECRRYRAGGENSTTGNRFVEYEPELLHYEALIAEIDRAEAVRATAENSEANRIRPIFQAVHGGELFWAQDFVTGVIETSRAIYCPQSVNDDLRRRFLFDVDQIV